MSASRDEAPAAPGRRAAALLVVAAALAAGCRKSDTAGAGAAPLFVPSTAGTNGCSGPDQAFTPGQVPQAVPLATWLPTPWAQLTAPADSETLYLTGAGATLVEVDVSGAMPVETEILTAAGGAVDALLAGMGIAGPAELSGVAVLDAGTLLVMEHRANVILAVGRGAPDAVALFAGAPNETPGFADGPRTGPGAARFAFTAPAQLAPLETGDVLLVDPGNHAVRVVDGGVVTTLAGTGSAFFQDGDLDLAGFDDPSGLSVTCSGQLVVTERGGSGGGHRLRQLALGAPTPFGLTGTVMTRAGAGLAATMGGVGVGAWLGAPVSPLVTGASDVYWIDGLTGILRRLSGPTDLVDCPLFTDCAQAVSLGGHFSALAAGEALSLTQTRNAVLYVLDGPAGTLFRVTP